ncbi:MAG: ferritin-like domain-containing protein [Gammaproteobacteria bacterium]
MKITKLNKTPDELIHFDLEERMSQTDIEDIVEIFKTPIVGSYNWDYTDADNRIKRLYELGKKLNWNASDDLDWSINYPKDQKPSKANLEEHLFEGWDSFHNLSEEDRLQLAWHDYSWTLSQFLHGEQGALLVASQLVSCAPTYQAKLYAASQTFDEARHVEVFNRYLQQKVGFSYPINPNLKMLLDKVLTDERWDLKFIGMQIIIEGLALAAFNSMKMTTNDELARNIVHYVIRDEARHVTFGVNYLEEFVATLTEKEREDRAQFAFEACMIMRDRIMAIDVYQRFMPHETTENIRSRIFGTDPNVQFRNLLFSRVVPNLSRIGLITDSIRERYDQIGLLDFEQAPSDWEIDWSEMEKPLESSEDIATQATRQSEALFGSSD